jgi:hypothetical protein
MELTVEALRALAFIHELDLIHRDLKPGEPSRPGLGETGCRLVIVDFGLTLRTDDEQRVAGTLPYLAPELLANRSASRRSDLYALGVVIKEIGPLAARYPAGVLGVAGRAPGRRARAAAGGCGRGARAAERGLRDPLPRGDLGDALRTAPLGTAGGARAHPRGDP